VSLSLQGKALQSAATGEAFSVMNPASKKVLQAVAVGPGEAVVGPQANLARSSLDRNTFASLR
jgi:flagella basal body P-ring formation protein FlgA